MLRFLNEYEVESQSTLLEDQPSLEIKPSCGSFTADISALKSEQSLSSARLLIHLQHRAESFEAAERSGREHVMQLLEMMAFACGESFGDPVLRCIVDWSEGHEQRTLHRFTTPDQFLVPEPRLGGLLAATVSQLFREDISPAVWRSLAWYRRALTAETPDLKVQCFWLCFETLIGDTNETEKVPDQCQKCRSPLFCRSCSKESMHRPFPTQKIKALLERHHEDGAEVFKTATQARNILMHGGTLVGPRAKKGFTTSELVDQMGEAAWSAIVAHLTQGLEWKESGEFIRPASYSRRLFRAVSHLDVTVPLEEGRLLAKNLPQQELTVVRHGNELHFRFSDRSESSSDVTGAAYNVADH